MQSPPSRLPRRASRKVRPARPLQILSAAWAALALLTLACGSGGGREPAAPPEARLPNLTPEERPYLVSPLAGYPLVVSVSVEEALSAGHEALLAGQAEGALTAAEGELSFDPGLHPAQVLWAQADFASGREGAALDRVRPVAEELPGYQAAGLLLARLEERRGEDEAAYRAFRNLAPTVNLAAQRAAELEPRALAAVRGRVTDSVRRGRLDQAETALEQLRTWAPEANPTLEAAAELAAARGDLDEELAALRVLSLRKPDDRALQERRADLELEAGEPGRGLEIFESLAAAYPDDDTLANKLAYAKLRWRLTLLPESVQELAGRPELERGDYAVLLFWLLPSVRYGEPARPRIAADILDDPRREEIARVINLDLMEVDETLHRFAPEQPVTRTTVLASQLAVLRGTEPPLACVRDLAERPSVDQVCLTAARCTLLERVEDCLPQAPISGREALDLLRRTLELSSTR